MYFHKESGEFASEHMVRLAKDKLVGDILLELKKALGPAVQDKTMRLMEVHNSKIFKVRRGAHPALPPLLF